MRAILALVPLAAPAQTLDSASLKLLDAVQSAVIRHPAVQILEQQIAVNRALRQQATGVFDQTWVGGLNLNRPYTPLTPTDRESLGVHYTGIVTDTATTTFGANRLLADGIILSESTGVSRINDNASHIGGLNLAQSDLQVTIPLLRGRGRAVTTAPIRAAERLVDASVLSLTQGTAAAAFNAASSYWNLVAAQKNLAIAVESVRRAESFLVNTRALVDADQSPRSDLYNPVANLASRQETQTLREQALLNAQQQLALDMGLTAEEAAGALTAAEDFPQPVDLVPSMQTASLRRYIEEALNRRADYLSLKAQVEQIRILRDAARNTLRPQLNVSFTTGFSGLTQGRQLAKYFSSPVASVQGMDSVAGITLALPTRNNTGLGKVAQLEAQIKQTEWSGADLARSIGASVIAAAGAVRHAVLEISKAHDAVNASRAALEGEQDKLTLGVGSIIDLLNVDDRVTTALQAEIDARTAYALAIGQFRLATGTIIPTHDAPPLLLRQTFVALPDALGPYDRN